MARGKDLEENEADHQEWWMWQHTRLQNTLQKQWKDNLCKKALPQQKMTTEHFSVNPTALWKCNDIPNTGIFLDWRDREKQTATLQKNLKIFPVLTITKTNSSRDLCSRVPRKESPPGVAALLLRRDPWCQAAPGAQGPPAASPAGNSSPGTASLAPPVCPGRWLLG